MPFDAAPSGARLDPDSIAEYLALLGFEHVDLESEQIRCWTSLQAFVAGSVAVRPVTKPNQNTRLKTYGMDQSHPVRLFIRHVLS